MMVILRPVWMTNHPHSVLWHCWLGHQTGKNRRPYNLYCVGADVKPCSINQCRKETARCSVFSLHQVTLRLLFASTYDRPRPYKYNTGLATCGWTSGDSHSLYKSRLNVKLQIRNNTTCFETECMHNDPFKVNRGRYFWHHSRKCVGADAITITVEIYEQRMTKQCAVIGRRCVACVK